MTRGQTETSYAVLFVDDEDKARKYFRMAYGNDFRVLTAGSVGEALQVLEREGDEIGVLITDQRMPGQQGVDLLKQVREHWPAIVRILTTAYSDLDDAITAVNRGEILRYVTKPWDIQGLRVELRHAMDFFLLRQERDVLMAEKFSVRQRMDHSDRLRGLLGLAAGLEHLRYAPHAVAAWLRDELACASDDHADAADLELWGQEVRATLGLMKTHRGLRAIDQAVEPGFPERVELKALATDMGLSVEGDTVEVAGRRDLLANLFGILGRLAGESAAAHLATTGEGDAEVTVTSAGSAARGNRSSDDLAADGERPDLLAAYLLAWHHGGLLRMSPAEDVVRFEVTLPADPESVVLDDPDEHWVEDQFSTLTA